MWCMVFMIADVSSVLLVFHVVIVLSSFVTGRLQVSLFVGDQGVGAVDDPFDKFSMSHARRPVSSGLFSRRVEAQFASARLFQC